jgi:hypothetical protein
MKAKLFFRLLTPDFLSRIIHHFKCAVKKGEGGGEAGVSW